MSTHVAAPGGLRILLTAIASSEHLSGVTRHAANLASCLLLRDEVSEVHMLVAPWQTKALLAVLPISNPRLHIRVVAMGRGAIARNIWLYNQLPRIAAEVKADIVHLAYPVPLRRNAFNCPTVVSLHDLYPYDIPSNFGFSKVLFNRLILQQCLRAADSIACVSDSTRQRAQMYLPRHVLRKLSILFNCVELAPAMEIESALEDWQGEPFLLCVAQHRKNKNLVFAIGLFERLLREAVLAPNAQLLLVGMDGPETHRIETRIRATHLEKSVLLLRGLSDAQLEWCYTHCQFLLAPSTIEGFGLPVVEAMLHHCPVVCSDIPAFREVGGSYCHYANLGPHAEDSFVTTVRVALQTHKFRPSSIECFSATRVGEACLQLYSAVMRNRATSSSSQRLQAMRSRGEA